MQVLVLLMTESMKSGLPKDQNRMWVPFYHSLMAENQMDTFYLEHYFLESLLSRIDHLATAYPWVREILK